MSQIYVIMDSLEPSFYVRQASWHAGPASELNNSYLKGRRRRSLEKDSLL